MTENRSPDVSPEAAGTTSRPASGIPASGLPANGLNVPFAVGNAVRMSHGVRSKRVYLPVAMELVAGLLETRPDLAAYPEEVAAWGEWEGRALLMRRHLADVGDLDDDGAPRRDPLAWLTRCEDRAARARERLGLTPFAEAALAKERASAALVAVDLEAIAARGREALAAREGEPEADLAGRALEAAAAAGREAQARAAERWRAGQADADSQARQR